MDRPIHQRPGWRERVGIVVACAILFVALTKLDTAAAHRDALRAQRALAAQARSERHVTRSGPISIPPISGAWSAGIAPRAASSPGASPVLPVAILGACGVAMAAVGFVLLRR